jgi:hypothetical protein
VNVLFFVFDHAGNNKLGLRLLSGASVELWESKEKRGPYWDWLYTPD